MSRDTMAALREITGAASNLDSLIGDLEDRITELERERDAAIDDRDEARGQVDELTQELKAMREGAA